MRAMMLLGCLSLASAPALAAESVEAPDDPGEGFRADPRPTSKVGVGGGVIGPAFGLEGALRIRITPRTTISPGISSTWSRYAPENNGTSSGLFDGGQSALDLATSLELRERVWHNARSDVPIVFQVGGSYLDVRWTGSEWIETDPDIRRSLTRVWLRGGFAIERWVAPGVVVSGGLYVTIAEHRWQHDGLQTGQPPLRSKTWGFGSVPMTSLAVHVFP